MLSYVLIAYVIALIAGGEYFLVVLQVSNYYPVDDYILVIPFLIFTYAIVKYRLLDIKIAVTRLGLFLVIYSLVTAIPFASFSSRGSVYNKSKFLEKICKRLFLVSTTYNFSLKKSIPSGELN